MNRSGGSPALRLATVVGLLLGASALAGAAAVPSAGVAAAPSAVPQAVGGDGAAFTPVEPCRLVDTRDANGNATTGDDGSTTWRIQVSGRCGQADEAVAAALTVTAVNASGNGFLSVGPAGDELGDTSNLNVRPGRSVANTVVVALSSDGAVDVRASVDVDVIVDVSGLFVDTDGPVAAGRLVPVAPSRVADTRSPAEHDATGVERFGSGELHIDLDGLVPDDATGVAIQVTAVAGQPGHLAAYAAGTSRPDTSVLNLDAVTPTRTTLLLTAVSEQGITVYRSSSAHLVVDVWGYFTGPSAEVSEEGLFIPEAPVRVWDSRVDHVPLHAGGRLTHDVAPAEAAVAVLNVTAVAPTDRGYLTVGAAGAAQPATSNLNYLWTEPVAGTTLVRNTTDGVTFWSPEAGTHVVVDRLGWFTGGAEAATAAADRNPMPTSGGRVLFISDSSLAGIRWSGSLGYLTGASFDARLESCRRLSGASCRGREGYAPYTALTEVRSVAPGTVDVLVIGTGYNDHQSRFLEGFEQIMQAARIAGIDRVVWLTYREPVTYSSPSQLSNAITFAANNRTLRAASASGAWPELRLLDWNAHSAGRTGWMTSDGVHVTVTGAREAALFISRALAHYDRRPCGEFGGVVDPGGWCADPTGR